MKRHRIKAFTIMEVTIVMLIASVVIGMAYTVYSIVVRSHGAFKTKNDHMAVIIRLDELLKKDFAHADLILKNQSGIVLTSPGQLINYEIGPNYIIRTNGIIDTFKVKTQQVTATFEEQPVTEISTEQEQNRIDDIELSLLFENEKIPYHYHKQYSSTNLITRKTNAVN
jgi:type II secretory pathway component PulJ